MEKKIMDVLRLTKEVRWMKKGQPIQTLRLNFYGCEKWLCDT